MHALVSAVAQDGLYVVALLAVGLWLMAPRAEKVAFAVEMVVGLVAVSILVKVAGAVHTDPRPFVQDPSIHPWFSHVADNGFPSDHTAVGTLTSVVVLRHRRTAGLVMLAITVLVAAGRVAAHVHHVQDVVAGAVIGLVSAVAGVLCWWAVRDTSAVRRLAGRDPAETASRGSTHAQ
jgi:membrane-associated phospholipid phosphatase